MKLDLSNVKVFEIEQIQAKNVASQLDEEWTCARCTYLLRHLPRFKTRFTDADIPYCLAATIAPEFDKLSILNRKCQTKWT